MHRLNPCKGRAIIPPVTLFGHGDGFCLPFGGTFAQSRYSIPIFSIGYRPVHRGIGFACLVGREDWIDE